MKKIISFCIFGNDILYHKGAEYNIELAKEIYPDWICRFYLFQECFYLEDRLKSNNVEIIKVNEQGSFFSTMYRFLPIGEQDVDFFICRDTDSRLSWREKEAVEDWLNSGKNFHIMKDHPYHYSEDFPILAGMWGAKGNIIPDIKNIINTFKQTQENKKGVDQIVLRYIFENFAKNSYYEQGIDSFPSPRNFKKDNIYFVGQPFDENNNFYGDFANDISVLLNRKVIVQIGACRGNDHVTKLSQEHNAQLFLVEANIHNIEPLKECYAYKQCKIDNIAIVPNKINNKITFYYSKNDGPLFEVSSIKKQHVLKYYDEATICSYDLDGMTLDEYLTFNNIKTIDYLFLDIEGIDADVFLNFPLQKYDIKNIQIEFLHLKEKQSLVEKKLTNNNYKQTQTLDFYNHDRMYTKENLPSG
jgi:FkbM family methyltransferase